MSSTILTEAKNQPTFYDTPDLEGRQTNFSATAIHNSLPLGKSFLFAKGVTVYQSTARPFEPNNMILFIITSLIAWTLFALIS